MDQPKQAIDIAILGAGIGGLALAIGLSKRGIPVTIYEAANEFSPIGGKYLQGQNVQHHASNICLHSAFRIQLG